MLGYVIYKNYSKLRKRTKKRFAIKIKRIKSRKRRGALVSSFYGMAKHSDTRNLLRLLLNKNEMKRFSDLNICFRDKNGKKKFDAETVSLSDLDTGKTRQLYYLDIPMTIKKLTINFSLQVKS